MMKMVNHFTGNPTAHRRFQNVRKNVQQAAKQGTEQERVHIS